MEESSTSCSAAPQLCVGGTCRIYLCTLMNVSHIQCHPPFVYCFLFPTSILNSMSTHGLVWNSFSFLASFTIFASLQADTIFKISSFLHFQGVSQTHILFLILNSKKQFICIFFSVIGICLFCLCLYPQFNINFISNLQIKPPDRGARHLRRLVLT